MNCPKCRCEGRVAWLDETGPKPTAHYMCANPQCPNYREEFGEEVLAGGGPGEGEQG